MNDLNSKKVSELCISCGMCCDGTLFNKGNIKDNDDKAFIESIGIEVFHEKGKDFFRQPCNQFKSCCTIYDKPRPSVCNNFFCDPLKKYQKNEINWEIAESQVLKALNIKNQILKLAVEFEELKDFNIRNIFDFLQPIIFDSKPLELKRFGRLILLYSVFDSAKKNVFTREKTEIILNDF